MVNESFSFSVFVWQGILTTLSQSNGRYDYDYATVPFLAEVFKVLRIPLFNVILSTFCVVNIYMITWLRILQLFVSSLFLWKESQKSPPPKMTTDWRTVRLYPIPSIIYLIHNNVQFATLTYVDTSTYQIMGNLKIVTTGILFRWFSIKYKWLCYINTYHFWNHFSHTRADISTSWFRLFLRRKLSNLQWMAIVLLAVGTTTSQVTAIQKKYASAILQIWLMDL